MEEEIQDKLEKIYNDYIRIEVKKYNDIFYNDINKFEILGYIKVRKEDTIRLGFSFVYKYDKYLTIDGNIYFIEKEIDYYISRLFKEE